MSRFYARDGAGDLLARYSFIEPLLPGRRVLEVGAAGATAGATALFLAERGAAAVVSVDEELAGIEEAARESQHPFVQFKAASLEALPEKAFDLVLYTNGAALASDPARVAAVHRLLSPRGRLVTALAVAEGGGLSQLAGEPAPGEVPTFESFVGALGDHFSFVEVATQSATIGYVVAMGQDAEPEVAIDGSLAGTSDTAWYVAICGDAPCKLQGLTIVALPTQPIFEAAAERDRLAATGGPAADEARREAAEAVAAREALAAERDSVRAELERVRRELDEATAAADAARLEGEKQDSELAAFEAERAALIADRDAVAEAREELAKALAGLKAEHGAQVARARELESALEIERETGFALRAQADKAQGLEAQRARALEEASRAAEERAQAQAELASLRSRSGEADAALQGARSEAQAARTAVEAALARATAAEAHARALEEELEANAAAAGDARARAEDAGGAAAAAAERLELLEAELARLRGVVDGVEGELAEARADAAARKAELAAVKAEEGAIAAERDALRERIDGARGTSEAVQARLAELEVRAAEVDRLGAELARRDDAYADVAVARDNLAAQVAELGARLETEEERLRIAEAQASEAKAQLEVARATPAALPANDAAHEEALARIAGQLEQMTGARDRIARQCAEARNAAEAAEAQAAELEAELQAVRWEKDELEQRVQSAQQAGTSSGAGEVGRLREEVALRSARIVEQERELVRLGAVVAELTSRPQGGASPDAAPSPGAADRAKELERRLLEAQRRAADAEALAAAKADGGAGEAVKALERIKGERDSLLAQLNDRDARLARLQREVVDKTERLGRLAKEMGELKAKGIGKLFK